MGSEDLQLGVEMVIAYLDRERLDWLGNKATRSFVACKQNEIRMDSMLDELIDLGYGVSDELPRD